MEALLHCKRADEIKVHSFFCDTDEQNSLHRQN